MATYASIKECMVLLQLLQTSKGQFSQNNQYCFKRLCERTEIFLSVLKSFQVETEGSIRNDAELKRTLTYLKELLCDIEDFVSKDDNDSLIIARKMVLNEVFRRRKVDKLSLFHTRLHRLRLLLLPTVEVSVEKNREEDLDDFQLDLEAMFEAVMEEVSSLRTNGTQFKCCLQAMKQECSEGQKKILNKLSEVEAMVASNQTISSTVLADIKHVVRVSLSTFMESLKSEFITFQTLFHDTCKAIDALNKSCDISQIEILVEIERDLKSFQACPIDKVSILKDQIGNNNRSLIQKLEEQLAFFNLLTVPSTSAGISSADEEDKEGNHKPIHKQRDPVITTLGNVTHSLYRLYNMSKFYLQTCFILSSGGFYLF
jgi:hypothetical protein